jgi:methionine aminotransferase
LDVEQLMDKFRDYSYFQMSIWTLLRKSIFQRIKLINRCITVSSFGKSFHVQAGRTGYLALRIFNERNETIFGFSVNSIICQVAISEYLDMVSINKISSFYQEKEITRFLLANSGLNSPMKVYFSSCLLRNYFKETDVAFTKRLIIEYGGVFISTFMKIVKIHLIVLFR